MHATLTRYYKDECTLGFLVFDKNTFFWTIELPDLRNLKDQSCIPESVYQVRKWVSPSKGNCFKVEVPSRENILIHIGNWTSDSKGCILPGMSAAIMNNKASGKMEKSVSSSGEAMKIMLQKYNDFTLRITTAV